MTYLNPYFKETIIMKKQTLIVFHILLSFKAQVHD